MKPIFFDFEFTVPKDLIFKPFGAIVFLIKVTVSATGCVIDGNPVVVVKRFLSEDQNFQYVMDNYELANAMRVAAMDEYKRLNANAKAISVVELAEDFCNNARSIPKDEFKEKYEAIINQQLITLQN